MGGNIAWKSSRIPKGSVFVISVQTSVALSYRDKGVKPKYQLILMEHFGWRTCLMMNLIAVE